MSEDFEALLSGKADSSAAPREESLDTGPLAGPPEPPLSDEEFQAMQESVVTGGEVAEDLDQNVDVDALASVNLHLLGPDEVPVVGEHYVVWGDPALPLVVVRGAYAVSENEHVRLTATGTNPLRQDRAEAYARWRYKGYVSGQVNGL